MKKLLSLGMSFVICFSMAACGGQDPVQSESTSTPLPEEPAAIQSPEEALEALGDIEVDENLFDVEITVPADFVGETTQEELDAKAKESDIHSITLNEDGSATYVMSKSQHKKLLQDMATSINQSLSEMVGSEDFPTITDIQANDNFTEFKVTVSAEELGLSESMSVLGFYMYGGLYGIFSGETPDNIHVDFVNADTGEIVFSANSSEAGQE